MTRNVISIGSILVLSCLVLAACSSSESPEDTTSTETSSAATTPPETATTSPPPDEAGAAAVSYADLSAEEREGTDRLCGSAQDDSASWDFARNEVMAGEVVVPDHLYDLVWESDLDESDETRAAIKEACDEMGWTPSG